MLRKSIFTVLLLLCCLVSVMLPKGLGQTSLTPPSVTLPSGWSLAEQAPYPTYEGTHDPQGSGFLKYNSSATQYDEVLIFYEDSMGISYSNAQLQAEAEMVYTRDLGNPFTDSGVTTYAGGPAGYVRVYNDTYSVYELQLIMVRGNYYLDVFSRFAPSGEVNITSVINSIIVPPPTPTPSATLTPSPTSTSTGSPTPVASSTPIASLPPKTQPLPTSTPAGQPSPILTPTFSPAPTTFPTSPQPTLTPYASSTATISPSSATAPISPSPSSSPPSEEASNITTTVWVPPMQNAAEASVVSVAAVGAVSLVFAAAGVGAAASGATATASAGGTVGKVAKKIDGVLPDTVKKWLEDFVSSKRKLAVTEKTGSPFVPTKPEALAYIVSTLFLAFSFSYVKANSLPQILLVLPAIFATSILVGFAKTFFSIVYSRSRGVWTEHKLWYFGLATFIITTFAFRMPFSSPTRNVHYGPKFTKRMGAILSSASILISLAFAGIFGVLLLGGFTVIGGTGLAMCIIGAFFDTFPIEPMSGKDIINHNKTLWACLFVVTITLYVSWLLVL